MPPRPSSSSASPKKATTKTKPKRHRGGKVALALAALPASQCLTASPHFSILTERTSSFGALWAGDFPTLPDTKVHTLILGTHPSIKSLEGNQYFAHPMNAFWWIAGDCLGFRRGSATTVKGTPYKFAADLREDHESIIPYSEQTRLFCSKGFALWDVVGSCERKGSLDQDIRNAVANDIRGFCDRHPHIQRIVLANGGTGSSMFLSKFRDWWLEGAFIPAGNEESQRAFGKVDKQVKKRVKNPIVCISALSVSPAAAKYDYKTKRDFWDEHVYSPGLNLHRELNEKGARSPSGVDELSL